MRQFDEAAVLDRMVATFWSRGYEATSIDDLERATGVKRQSLYNAFGKKEAMFGRALDRYGLTVAAGIRSTLDGPEPRQAIARFLEAHIDRMADSSCPSGCMIAGSSHELGGRADALGSRVQADTRSGEAALLAALTRWRADGMLDPDRDLQALARFLLALVRGMAGIHKATGDVALVRDAAMVCLAAVEPWLTPAGRDL